MQHNRSIVLVGAGALALIVAAAHVLNAAPDTLDPPPGPVTGTGHTLEEIYDRIGDVQAQALLSSGPWEVLFLSPSANQGSRIQLIDGPVLVHSIIYYNLRLMAYDGMTGPQFGDFRVESGGTTGFEVHNYQVMLDVILNDGLFATYDEVAANSSTITILYKSLTSE